MEYSADIGAIAEIKFISLDEKRMISNLDNNPKAT